MILFFGHRANSKTLDPCPDVRSSVEALQLSNELDEQRFKSKQIETLPASPTDDIPLYGYSKIKKQDQKLSLQEDVGKIRNCLYYTGNSNGNSIVMNECQ